MLAVVIGVIGIVIVLASENALVVHPKGIIAQNELELIITNIVLMLIIIVPTYILLFAVVWKYCIKNENAKYDPDHYLRAYRRTDHVGTSFNHRCRVGYRHMGCNA